VSEPPVLAAIDVGTNSFHLVIARMRPGGGIDVMTRQKDMVRLGHGGGDMKLLDPDAMARGLTALARMRQLADAAGAPIRAVATSAVREARNANEFVRRAADEAGIEIEVISGTEEARLIHLGVLQALPVFDRKLLLCDIGGGSTELLLGHRGEVAGARSFKLGAVRLTDRFFPDGDAKPRDVRACREFVRSTITVFRRAADRHHHEVAVASSGTAENVVRMAAALRSDDNDHSSMNGATVTVDEIGAVCDLLVRTERSDRADLAGIDPKRADIALAGSLILHEVAGEMGVSTFTFSEGALREGVLLDTLARTDGSVVHHLDDVSRRSVRRLMEQCDDDPRHAENVARLALALYDETRLLHGLDAGTRDYLEAAALLANVGLFVAHDQHHRHSYYLIRNAETLTGFTRAEVEIIALVARYHRKSAPKNDHPEFAALGDRDRAVVRTLAGLLRVAIGLDRRHDGRVAAVSVNRVGERIEISAAGQQRDTDLSLEMYAANERSALLTAVLGSPIAIT
jgi:exopolyphosphatase / guanosine-5'-triphosphate,3'-diphosphate pyrophosphatase